MRKITWFVCLIVAALALPGHASARTCSAGRAIPVSIERVKAERGFFDGKCVKIRGILFGGYVFADRQALSEPRIDVYVSKRSIAAGVLPSRQPIWAEVTGELSDCAAVQRRARRTMARHPDVIVMMISGFCHHSSDVHIRSGSVRTLSTAPILRLTEAEVPFARCDLIEAATAAQGRQRHIAAARSMLAALANGTAPAASIDSDGPIDFRRLRTVTAGIIARPGAPMRIFVPHFSERPGIELAWTCWCTAGDCAGRWPVSDGSADNMPGRPYFCIVTTESSGVISTSVPSFNQGLAEPAW